MFLVSISCMSVKSAAAQDLISGLAFLAWKNSYYLINFYQIFLFLALNLSYFPLIFHLVFLRFHNKERLATRDDLSVDVEDYRTKLSVVIATRKHTGTYVLKAENSSGKDEATIQINVLDVPAKPEGPLKVRSVHIQD